MLGLIPSGNSMSLVLSEAQRRGNLNSNVCDHAQAFFRLSSLQWSAPGEMSPICVDLPGCCSADSFSSQSISEVLLFQTAVGCTSALTLIYLIIRVAAHGFSKFASKFAWQLRFSSGMSDIVCYPPRAVQISPLARYGGS